MQNQRQYELTLNGARLIADLTGALYWPAGEAVIVADVHFEKGSAYAARGVALPPYDTAATLGRLETVMAAYRPKRFISLGDTFHDDFWAARMVAQDRVRLFELLADVDVIWVTGNHDPTPPKDLPGAAWDVALLDFDAPLVLRHEPLPRDHADFRPGEVAGHLHPCGKIRQRGRHLRRRCFIHDAVRMVLPAFGALTGSLNVRDVAFDDLFSGTDYQAVLLGEARLASVEAKRLLPDRASMR